MTTLPDDLAAHRELADEATPGPYKHDTMENVGENWLLGCVFDAGAAIDDTKHIVTTDNLRASECISGGAKEDAAFIAANSPEVIAALIDAIDALSLEHDLVTERIERERGHGRPSPGNRTAVQISVDVKRIETAAVKFGEAHEKSTDALDRLKAAYKEKDDEVRS